MLLLDSTFRYLFWNTATGELLHHGQIIGADGATAGPVPCYTPWIDLASDGETLGFVGVTAKSVFRYNMRSKQLTQSLHLPVPPGAQRQSGFSRFDQASTDMLSVYFTSENRLELVVTTAKGELKALGSLTATEGQLIIGGSGDPFWVFCFQNPAANQNRLFFANTKTYGVIKLDWQGIPCGLLLSKVPQRYDATGTKYLVHSYFNQSTTDNASPGISILEIDRTKLDPKVTSPGADLHIESQQHLILKSPPGEPNKIKVFLPDAVFDPVLNQILIKALDQTICQIRVFGTNPKPEASLVGYIPFKLERSWKSCINYEQNAFSYFKVSSQQDRIVTKRVSNPNIKALTLWMLQCRIPQLRPDESKPVIDLLLESSLY